MRLKYQMLKMYRSGAYQKVNMHVNFAKIFAYTTQFERSVFKLRRTELIRNEYSSANYTHTNATININVIAGFRRRVNWSCALFWDSTRRRMVVPYRRFGTTYRLHLQDSRNLRIKQLVSADE